MLNLAVRNALVLTPVVFGLRACGQDAREKAAGSLYAEKARRAVREYIFAIHPLHNPLRLFEIYDPLIDYLNRNIPGAAFRLEASRNYAEFGKKLYARQFNFALPNPFCMDQF